MAEKTPQELLETVKDIRDKVLEHSAKILARWQPMLGRPAFEAGATNLAHYLAFREMDLRDTQRELVHWGISGLGRSEGKVMATLDAVIANLSLICGAEPDQVTRPSAADFDRGTNELMRNAEILFGSAAPGRMTRILVTMAAKAGKDPDHVRTLFGAGMDAARINCAHDGPKVWKKMIDNIRTIANGLGRRCPILMDLQGPKIRTRTVLRPEDREEIEPGDHLLITFDEPRPNREFPFQASCAMPEVLRQVAEGARVSIKDGLIRGFVEEVRPEGLLVSVERTPPEGQLLESEKGINFPGTELVVSPLSDEDLRDLDFVAEHADMVGYSFVQKPEDIALLQRELEKRRGGKPPMAIVAKIETQLGFHNLPDLIVQAAGANPFAVMIARGDLAVEIGYERLSEVQEEILWVCEAAHIPVIWATQVLESLVKRGMPSRGEFTDAAMGNRAECVMLNKGPFIAEGVGVLDNVLRRMEQHMVKKTPQLRALSAWKGMH